MPGLFVWEDTMSEIANPWLPENWNLTAQGDYVKKYGVSVATRTAKLAGSSLGALKPRTGVTVQNLTIIQRKSFGGGIVGAGSSGSGPPG